MARVTGLFGDWKKVRPKIAATQYALRHKARGLLYELAEKYLELVVKHIASQDFALQALALSTTRQKGTDLIFYDKGTYVKKLTSKILLERLNEFQVAAGAFESIIYKGSITMHDIAKWQEYGTDTIPARPLYTLTLKELLSKNDIPKKFRRYIKGIWRV